MRRQQSDRRVYVNLDIDTEAGEDTCSDAEMASPRMPQAPGHHHHSDRHRSGASPPPIMGVMQRVRGRSSDIHSTSSDVFRLHHLPAPLKSLLPPTSTITLRPISKFTNAAESR